MGLNWSAGAAGIAEGLEGLGKVKEKQLDREMENIRQANYARLRKELQADSQAFTTSNREEDRKQKVADRKEDRKHTVADAKTAHDRRMEEQREVSSRYGGATGIFGKISATGAWTPESMAAVQDAYEKDPNTVDWGLLVPSPEAKPSKQEYLNDIIEAMYKIDPDYAPTEEEKNAIIANASNAWDTHNPKTETKIPEPAKSVTGSAVTVPPMDQDFGSRYSGEQDPSPFDPPGDVGDGEDRAGILNP